MDEYASTCDSMANIYQIFIGLCMCCVWIAQTIIEMHTMKSVHVNRLELCKLIFYFIAFQWLQTNKKRLISEFYGIFEAKMCSENGTSNNKNYKK